MLILIGTVPTAYALNHAVTPQATADFVAVSHQAEDTLKKYVSPSAVVGDPRSEVTDYIRTREFKPATMLGLEQLVNSIAGEASLYKELKNVPENMTPNLRNDMYVASEALRLMKKSGTPPQLTNADWTSLDNYRKHIDNATKFIPTWVTVAVAFALGLGTIGGMEAHRGYGGRKDRQAAFDLRPGRFCRNHCDGHDRGGGPTRLAGQHHACFFRPESAERWRPMARACSGALSAA